MVVFALWSLKGMKIMGGSVEREFGAERMLLNFADLVGREMSLKPATATSACTILIKVR